jgi:hypothetical protein
VGYKETLETSAVVSELAYPVQDEVDNFFTDGVVTTGAVVGGIFFTRDQLLGVVELTVGTGADFVNDGWLEVNVHSTGDMFTSTSLREKGVEGIIASSDSFVRGHLSVRLDTVFEAEKLP